MFEDLWNGILELTSRFIIPDWGSVVAMLPVLIFALAILVIVVLFWKIWRAPKARRGKVRVEPVPPPGVHMPGPSWAPALAALGAFALFLGLVFTGPLLVIGAIILSITLLYWLVEAVRIYDHDLGETAPPLPAAVHAGPPPGVHMPGPSFLPFLAAVGMAMLFLGLVFGEWLLAVGVIGLIVTLVGWMSAARQEYVKTLEADTTGHLEALPEPKTPKLMLSGLAILLVAAFVIQVGWIPPRAAGGEAPPPGAASPSPDGGGPPASGEPPGSPGPGGGLELHAKDIAFVETSLTIPADQPVDLHYFNEDEGIPHDVAFRDSSGAEAFKGEVVTGVADIVYKVPPLAAGTYEYICTIHPNMTGTATVQ